MTGKVRFGKQAKPVMPPVRRELMPQRLADRTQRQRRHQVGEQRAQLRQIGQRGARRSRALRRSIRRPAHAYCCGLPHSGQNFALRGIGLPHSEQNFGR